MIELHTMVPAWGLPTFTPFGLKLIAYMQMASIQYEIVVEHDPTRGPTNKFPWIVDEGRILGDSSVIVERLRRHARRSGGRMAHDGAALDCTGDSPNGRGGTLLRAAPSSVGGRRDFPDRYGCCPSRNAECDSVRRASSDSPARPARPVGSGDLATEPGGRDEHRQGGSKRSRRIARRPTVLVRKSALLDRRRGGSVSGRARLPTARERIEGLCQQPSSSDEVRASDGRPLLPWMKEQIMLHCGAQTCARSAPDTRSRQLGWRSRPPRMGPTLAPRPFLR